MHVCVCARRVIKQNSYAKTTRGYVVMSHGHVCTVVQESVTCRTHFVALEESDGNRWHRVWISRMSFSQRLVDLERGPPTQQPVGK